MGGVDEELIADGRLRVLDDPATLELRKREAPIGVLHPRDPGSSSTACSGLSRRSVACLAQLSRRAPR